MQTRAEESIVSVLAELEFINALELRIFRKEISATQGRSSVAHFEQDLRDGVFELRGLTDEVFERARQLSRQTTAKLGTRTADVIHVAAALEFRVDYLYTFDQQQKKLAQLLRLGLN
jgi:predicted nucleic acid-binding protein